MELFRFRATEGVAETTPIASPKKIALERVIAAITRNDGVFIWRHAA